MAAEGKYIDKNSFIYNLKGDSAYTIAMTNRDGGARTINLDITKGSNFVWYGTTTAVPDLTNIGLFISSITFTYNA
jgi:hypothetical protein